MNAQESFQAVVHSVKQPTNYVPRDYQTIGGGWTRDTWKQDDVTVYLEDEGATLGIIFKAQNVEQIYLHVSRTYGGELEYRVGDETTLKHLALGWLTAL